jgi:hypothetical protein
MCFALSVIGKGTDMLEYVRAKEISIEENAKSIIKTCDNMNFSSSARRSKSTVKV